MKTKVLKKFFTQLIILWVFISNPLYAENQTSNAILNDVKTLLDSWKGRPEALIEAKSKIDQILKVEPDNPGALTELARYHLKNGYINSRTMTAPDATPYSVMNVKPTTFEFAELALNKAISKNPNFADAYVLLGYVYFEQNKFDDARIAFEKAEAIGTKNIWLPLNKAQLLIATGHSDQAAQQYLTVLKNEPNNTKALGFLIGYYQHRREYKKTKNVYKKIIELEPDNAWVRGNYAEFLRTELGQFDEAVRFAREALKIMDYGVGQKILAESLYVKWADLIVNKKKAESTAKPYFDEAYALYPYLGEVMAYQGAYVKQEALVRQLISRGVSIDSGSEEDGSTALIIAANRGRTDAVKMLLSLGANPNVKSKYNWTALFGAADDGYPEIATSLLKKGADTTVMINNMDAASWADNRGHTDVAKLIRSSISPSK